MWSACWPDPHLMSSVVAPVVSGRPFCSHALRAIPADCSAIWYTQPVMTLSTCAGSIPLRAISPS